MCLQKGTVYVYDPLRDLGCAVTGGRGEQLIILFLELKFVP